jgi:hypothetical protein
MRRGAIQFVVIPVSDDVTFGLLTGAIPFGSNGMLVVQAQIADARVSGDQVRDRICAVVDDDQLPVRIVLTQEVPDRLRHETAAVVRGHDAGDEREIVHRLTL